MARIPLLALVLAALPAGAATSPDSKPWRVPPLGGELTGELTLAALPETPVQWSFTVRTERPRERDGVLTLRAPGLSIRAEVTVDPAGEGTWRGAEAEIDLTRWFAAGTPYLPIDYLPLTVQGTLAFSGAGTWRDGQLAGRAVVSLRNGRIDDPARKLVLEGVETEVAFEDIAAPRTASAQVFTWRTGQYDTIALGAGRIVFALAGDEIRLEETVAQVLGGEVRLGAVVVSTKKPDISVTATVSGVDVTQLLFLLPPILADAKGRLDGQLALRRDEAGLQIGTGNLTLRPGETAELRLAPTPGLLSASLPAAVLKHYPGLGQIEMGEVPLRADSLEVTFTPQGDAEGRTAWVHVTGGPVDPKLTAPIDLTVNVRGPLDSLIKFGTDSRLKFGGSR
jgi:hypothetical protein